MKKTTGSGANLLTINVKIKDVNCETLYTGSFCEIIVFEENFLKT